MNAPLIEQVENVTYRGSTYEVFELSGPIAEHRSLGPTRRPARLIFPCDLEALDSGLARLPQNKPRMGFRVNLNLEPWMLKPNGNFATAKVARKDRKRIGWSPTDWYVHPQGLCLMAGDSYRMFRLEGETSLPRVARIGQAIAGFCQQLTADPASIRDYGVDAQSHCMCCGKALSVNLSQLRGVGPECLAILNLFLGENKTLAEIESKK